MVRGFGRRLRLVQGQEDPSAGFCSRLGHRSRMTPPCRNTMGHPARFPRAERQAFAAAGDL
jgi:hypothetical protein